MIVEVRQAFKQNINSIRWMDGVTKSRVSEKVTEFVGVLLQILSVLHIFINYYYFDGHLSSQADAMADDVGFPDYLIKSEKFKKKFHKYNDVSIDGIKYTKY